MEKKELGRVKLVPYYKAKFSGMYRWDFQAFEECDQLHRAAVNEQGEVLFVAKYKDLSYTEISDIFVVEKIDNGTLRLANDNFNWDSIILDRGGYIKTLEQEIDNEIKFLNEKKREIQKHG